MGSPARVLAFGAPADVAGHPGVSGAVRIDRPRGIVIPTLVNAHTHLDLTHIGPRPFDADQGFAAWVDMVRRERRIEPGEIKESVLLGAALSQRGGVAVVGDIGGAPLGRPCTVPLEALAGSALCGVGYVEFFAIGAGEAGGLERIEAIAERLEQLRCAAENRLGVSPGLQPHAPNTVSPDGYRLAAELAAHLGCPLATHLAETPEEREFIARGTGKFRSLLEGIGLWEPRLLDTFGRGRSPVAHLSGWLLESKGPVVAAHCNDVSDEDIRVLAESGVSVAYCPRASAYFGAEKHFGAHRYRDMLGAGVNVCLGTDSIINLPDLCVTGPAARLSTLDEMRFLYRRDGANPADLLRMATSNGCIALGVAPDRLAADGKVQGTVRGLLCVDLGEGSGDPLQRMLSQSEPPEILLWCKDSRETGI